MAFLLRSVSPYSGGSAWIEDDDKVVYGYLVAEDIIGFVWLYNRIKAPDVPEWTLPDARSRMPFLNAAEFVKNPKPEERVEADFAFHWTEKGVGIYLNDKLLAIIHAGEKPGRCRNALTDGPVARALVIADDPAAPPDL